MYLLFYVLYCFWDFISFVTRLFLKPNEVIKRHHKTSLHFHGVTLPRGRRHVWKTKRKRKGGTFHWAHVYCQGQTHTHLLCDQWSLCVIPSLWIILNTRIQIVWTVSHAYLHHGPAPCRMRRMKQLTVAKTENTTTVHLKTCNGWALFVPQPSMFSDCVFFPWLFLFYCLGGFITADRFPATPPL